MAITGKERMKPRKLRVSELIWHALVNAESDRDSYADAVGRSTAEGMEAIELARQLRAYRLRRYGQSAGEVAFAKARLMPVSAARRVTARDLPNSPRRCPQACVYSVKGICSDPNLNRGNGDAACHETSPRTILGWLERVS